MALENGPSPLNLSTTALLLSGVALGLGAAMPIGPVNVEMARRAIRGGFLAGAALGLGAVSVDVSYALLYWVGVQQFTRIDWVYWTLASLGIGLLTWLGVASLRSAWRGGDSEILGNQPSPSLHGGYLTGLLMTATNPMTIAYWFSVLPAAAGNTGRGWRDLPIICVGVLLGTLAWVIFLSSLLGYAGKYRQPWWLRIADAAGGVFMLSIAAIALWRVQHRSL